jgi:O-antigen/teichoic acid export membrane protein
LVARSFIVNGIDYAVQFAAVLLVTPRLAEGLGLELYGVWLLVLGLLSYVSFLDAGVSTAGSKFIAGAIGKGDDALVGRRLGAVRRLLNRAGWQALAALAVLALGMGSWVLWFGGTAEALAVVTVFVAPTVLTFWLRDHLLYLRASLRFEMIAATTIGRTIVQSALVLWTLDWTTSLVWIALAHAVPQIGAFLLQAILAGRELRRIGISISAPESEDMAELRGISRYVFTAQMASGFVARAEPLLVSAMAGVSAVPLHNAARRLPGMVNDAFQTAVNPVLTSRFAHLTGRENRGSTLRELGRACEWCGFLGGFAAGLLVVCAPPFLVRWMPPGFEKAAGLIALLAPALALRTASTPISAYLLGYGRHRALAALSVTLALTNLLLMIGLGLVAGLIGVFAGLAISEGALFAVILPVVMHEHLVTTTFRFFFIQVLAPLVLGASIPLSLMLLIPWLLEPSYPKLALFTVLTVALAAVTIGVVGGGRRFWPPK